MAGDAALYLEDFPPGRRFAGGGRTITAAEIVAFARDFDPQPFHTDPPAAEASFFGGLAASGWHTAALTMRLLVETVPIARGLIGAGGELVWPRPTRPGDTLRILVTVESATRSRSTPDRGWVVIRTETLNQHDEPVQILTARMTVPCRP
ncbi:MAG: MaoC family dehydratase [Amaricoccus sp.]